MKNITSLVKTGKFLETVDDAAYQASIEKMKDFFCIDSFENLDFIDIGCGSGLS